MSIIIIMITDIIHSIISHNRPCFHPWSPSPLSRSFDLLSISSSNESQHPLCNINQTQAMR